MGEITQAFNKAKSQAKVASTAARKLGTDPELKRDHLIKVADNLDKAIDSMITPTSMSQINIVRWSTGKLDDALDFVIESVKGMRLLS